MLGGGARLRDSKPHHELLFKSLLVVLTPDDLHLSVILCRSGERKNSVPRDFFTLT